MRVAEAFDLRPLRFFAAGGELYLHIGLRLRPQRLALLEQELLAAAKEKAEQVARQAKVQAEQVLAECDIESERRRLAAQREVDELLRQKNEITGVLAQMRQVFLVTGADSAEAS